VKTDRSVCLPAPLLFNLDRRNGWSLMEDELDAYVEEHPPPVHDEEGAEESGQPPTLRISHMSSLIMIMRHQLHLHENWGTITPMMTHQPGATTRDGIDLHLGKNLSLGEGTPMIHSSTYHILSVTCISMFRFLYCSCFFFPKHKRPKIFLLFLFVCLFSLLVLVCFTCYFRFDI
jgi:hypothetical protein